MPVRLLCVVESDARRSITGWPERCRSFLALAERNTRRLPEAVFGGVLSCVASVGALPVGGSWKDSVSVAPPGVSVSAPEWPAPLLDRYRSCDVVFGRGQSA